MLALVFNLFRLFMPESFRLGGRYERVVLLEICCDRN